MFNKIRFENKINIEMWVSFEILESFVGERVNKIRFVGSINKEIRLRENSVRTFRILEKRRKTREGEKSKRAAIFCTLR